MREVGRGGRSPARTTHLVEEGELSPAAAVQVEAGVAGGVQPAVPGEGPQHLGGIWGEDGQEVAAFAEVSGAPPQGCVALVLEVLEGGGAVGGAEGDGHAGNMAFVPERTGQGGAGEGSRTVPQRLGARSVGPAGHLPGLKRLPKVPAQLSLRGRTHERGAGPLPPHRDLSRQEAPKRARTPGSSPDPLSEAVGKSLLLDWPPLTEGLT